MPFKPGDIPFFSRYQFSDTGEERPHFALVLLPESATKYQNSVLCCVITSHEPKSSKLCCCLRASSYSCFDHDSYVYFNRKDLVSKSGLGPVPQPKATLNPSDIREAFKKLKRSIYAVPDLVSNDPYLRGAVISEWKSIIKSLPPAAPETIN